MFYSKKDSKSVLKNKIKRGSVTTANKVINTIEGKFREAFKSSFKDLLSDYEPEAESFSDPLLYFDLFEAKIDALDFFEITDNIGNRFSFEVIRPTVDSFDWEGLGPIGLLATEGFFGVYYELEYAVLEDIVDRGLVGSSFVVDFIEEDNVIDATEVLGFDFILIHEIAADIIRPILPENTKFNLFPFSESPPVDFFAPVNKEMDTLYIKDMLRRELKSVLSGVR